MSISISSRSLRRRLVNNPDNIMADYVYNTGKGRFSANPNNYRDRRSEPVGYEARAEVYRDHVCRPVIVGADGRTRPGVIVLPAEHKVDNFINKTETVLEHVYAPSAYTRVPPNHGDDFLDYLRYDDGRSKPEAFSSDQISKVTEFICGVQTEASAVGKTSGFPAGMFQRRPVPTGGWNEPVSYANTVTRPTNDIGALADYAKESARPQQNGRFMASPPVFQVKETDQEIIDSREAGRRYANLPALSPKKDPSLPTISSSEAARRYKGQLIN